MCMPFISSLMHPPELLVSIIVIITLSMAKLSSFASPSRFVHTRTVNSALTSEEGKVATQPLTGNRSSLKNPPHCCTPFVANISVLVQHVSPFTDTYASSLSLGDGNNESCDHDWNFLLGMHSYDH